jgi:predicted LPLAT superfamily acyltransferase
MRVCIIIPVYNHGDALVATLDGLSPRGLPIIVVDDGSDTRNQARIAAAAAAAGATLLRFEENRGKGAAVLAGFREADRRGFTHALQVDADGQHDLNDVPRLVERAREHPGAMISGNPQFDASAPASRLYGRAITRFWVWIETLSFAIPDAMCGFRVYPLAPCLRLIARHPPGQGMEFDIEIAVRLYWQGVPFIAVPTRVIYPDGGTSHFRVVADNWRITRTHTRLFFGMLLRLPLLLMRKLGMRPQHWSGLEERGATTGMKILFAAYRLFGRWVFRILLFPVMSYFYLTSTTARRASRKYLDRVQETRARLGGQPSPRLHGFRHFLQFGESILDKTAQWAGVRSRENINYVAPEIYAEIAGRERGGVFIGSHLGNLEALRAFGGLEQGLTVNALVFTRHSLKFMKFLEEANPRAVEHIIQVDTLGPESVIRLAQRIDAGEWVAMVADRTSISHGSRSLRCEFLGHPAWFPEGPFILASLLDCPVYFLFCLKKGRRYDVYLEKLAESLALPRASRREELQRVVTTYANRLEQRCLEFPYQWYNFFDFWQEPGNGG